jgi:gas vesicle protein
MNNSSKMIAAAVAGIAAGAVLGVLFAPDKGSETRKKITDQGKKLADEVKNRVKNGKEKMNKLAEDIEKTVKEKVEEFA